MRQGLPSPLPFFTLTVSAMCAYVLDSRLAMTTSPAGVRVVSVAAAGATPPPLPLPQKAAAAPKVVLGEDGKPLSKKAQKRLAKGKTKKSGGKGGAKKVCVRELVCRQELYV